MNPSYTILLSAMHGIKINISTNNYNSYDKEHRNKTPPNLIQM